MDSTDPALKPPTAAVAAAVSLPLNGLNVIGQSQDTRADERLRRVSAVGFLHVSGGKIQHVPSPQMGISRGPCAPTAARPSIIRIT